MDRKGAQQLNRLFHRELGAGVGEVEPRVDELENRDDPKVIVRCFAKASLVLTALEKGGFIEDFANPVEYRQKRPILRMIAVLSDIESGETRVTFEDTAAVTPAAV